MNIYLGLVIGFLFTWLPLIMILPLASNRALPGKGTTVLRLAVIAAVVNMVQLCFIHISMITGMFVSVVFFYIMLIVWFRISLWRAAIVVILTWIVRAVAILGLDMAMR
jgi:hypothetical protein